MKDGVIADFKSHRAHAELLHSSAEGVACIYLHTSSPLRCDVSSPKIGDVPQRKKLSTTIGASNYAYLHSMVKTGRAESVGAAVDRAVEMARRRDNRVALERQTAAYFSGLTPEVAAEEANLEDTLSTASQEMDFDQP
jgi:hypothetical protein